MIISVREFCRYGPAFLLALQKHTEDEKHRTTQKGLFHLILLWKVSAAVSVCYWFALLAFLPVYYIAANT